MSLLREKLNRLRGVKPEAERTGATPEHDWNREREPGEAPDGGRESHADRAWRSFGAREEKNAGGTFLIRRIEYPADYRHGRYALGGIASAAEELRPLLAAAEERRIKRQRAWPGHRRGRAGSKRAAGAATAAASVPERLSAERLLFLDTETTGLGVGAGNVPFLIGLAFWEPSPHGEGEGRLVSEQLFMRRHGEEAAMLEHLRARMAGRDILVTYNGLSFDWPLIRNRYVMNRLDDGPEPAGHLDWLYPSRSLWRHTLESCRLGAVEESRLGVARVDDLPGNQAPLYYAMYLNDGDPEPMFRVFRHNEWDLLSLVGLGIHFARLLTGQGGAAGARAPELFRLGEWLLRHDRPGLADAIFSELEERPDSEKWPLLPALADSYKRRGRLERAVRLWREYAEAALPAASVEPYVELAMYYEHRNKDYREAIAWCRRAIETVRRREALLRRSPSDAGTSELQKRLARLERKLSRSGSGSAPDAVPLSSGRRTSESGYAAMERLIEMER